MNAKIKFIQLNQRKNVTLKKIYCVEFYYIDLMGLQDLTQLNHKVKIVKKIISLKINYIQMSIFRNSNTLNSATREQRVTSVQQARPGV